MVELKVLSLKEPYASLIKEKKKLIETRSFKTNYRGELYIHASINKSKIDNNLLELVENLDLNCGYIICKCNLVDCIYMTEEYVNNMKKNNYQEYICGEYKVGRYAWILDDVEEIQPIRAKGNLNIWNYYNEFDVLDLMQDIKDGWLDKNNHHFSYDELIYLDYSQTVEVVEVDEKEEKREENLSPVTSLVQVNNIEKLSANERLKLLLSDETLRGIQVLLSGTQTSNLSNEIPIEYTKLTDIKIKNCRMSESIYNRLVEHCQKNNLTITSVLNYLIDSYLKNR